MEKVLLLAEIEDAIRTMPPRATIRHENPENLAWFGRVSALIGKWNPAKSVLVKEYCDLFFSNGHVRETGFGLVKLLALLNEARHDLRMETVGPTAVAIAHKNVFEYFDEIRKIIELAKQDLLFVDPYLDAEFVSRFLAHAPVGVRIRLLAREKMATLLPAVDVFARQNGTVIEVRSATGFHDRYVFVDRTDCYQSGASFKDGARTAPTTITQVTDALPAVLKTYEDLWNAASVERSTAQPIP